MWFEAVAFSWDTLTSFYETTQMWTRGYRWGRTYGWGVPMSSFGDTVWPRDVKFLRVNVSESFVCKRYTLPGNEGNAVTPAGHNASGQTSLRLIKIGDQTLAGVPHLSVSHPCLMELLVQAVGKQKRPGVNNSKVALTIKNRVKGLLRCYSTFAWVSHSSRGFYIPRVFYVVNARRLIFRP